MSPQKSCQKGIIVTNVGSHQSVGFRRKRSLAGVVLSLYFEWSIYLKIYPRINDPRLNYINMQTQFFYWVTSFFIWLIALQFHSLLNSRKLFLNQLFPNQFYYKNQSTLMNYRHVLIVFRVILIVHAKSKFQSICQIIVSIFGQASF